MEQLGSVVLECGRRQMTRVVCDVGQPHCMETCGVEEPYEGNLHVRFCGGIGRVIADPTRTRLLDPVTTVHLFILQILHGNTACSHLPRLVAQHFTASAFCQARTRLPLGVW